MVVGKSGDTSNTRAIDSINLPPAIAKILLTNKETKIGEIKYAKSSDGKFTVYKEQNANGILSTCRDAVDICIGLIGIMATSPTITLADNTTKNVDFISAMTASLANLGNIGPAVAVGSVNAGPAGNYYAYSETAKIIMILLMFIGRVGVISLLLVFVSAKGEQRISLVEEHFDSDLPTLIR